MQTTNLNNLRNELIPSFEVHYFNVVTPPNAEDFFMCPKLTACMAEPLEGRRCFSNYENCSANCGGRD